MANKTKAEMIEGPQAKANFERKMKAMFRVSKTEVKEAEQKYKATRMRKKS